MGRVSWEEKLARKEARKDEMKKNRDGWRKYWKSKSRTLHHELIGKIKSGEAGLSQTQIAQFSGADPSTVSNFMRGKTESIRFSTYVAIAGACGYRVVLEEIPEDDDVFYSERRVKKPPRAKDLSGGKK